MVDEKNDKKKIVWKFDNDKDNKSAKLYVDKEKSNKAELEQQFVFELKRYKDSKSKKEKLTISVLFNGDTTKERELFGEIETTISKLDKDIRRLEDYGVVWDGIIYTDLSREIRKIYPNLEVNNISDKNNVDKENEIDNKEFKNMVTMLCEVMEQSYESKDMKSQGKLYNLPVEEFKQIIQESEYKEYNITKIKEKLRDNYIKFTIKENKVIDFSIVEKADNESLKIIKCSYGRTDNLVRIGKKPTRVITFYGNVVDNVYNYINFKESNTSENGEN